MNKLYIFFFIILISLFTASYEAKGQSPTKSKEKQPKAKKTARVIAPVGAPFSAPKPGTQIKYVPVEQSSAADENALTQIPTPEAPVKNKKVKSFRTEILRSMPQLDSIVSGFKSEDEFAVLLPATVKRDDQVLQDKLKEIKATAKTEQLFSEVNLTKLLDFPPFLLITPKSLNKEFIEKLLLMDRSQYVVLSSFSQFDQSNLLRNYGVPGSLFYKEIAGFIAYNKLQNSLPKAEPVPPTEASLLPSAP